MEKVLCNPPKITAPPALLEQLEAAVSLRSPAPSTMPIPFWRRWIPALSFGLIVLGCLVVLGIQTTQLTNLNRENAALQQQASALESASSGTDGQQSTAEQLELLRRNYDEVQKLRAEIDQLRQQIAQVPELKAQQEALRAQLQAKTAAANADDPFAAHKAKADSVACINNLKQIGLAARLWANEHGDVFPPDFVAMRNELNTPKILVCPADTAKLPAAASWEQFNPSMVSYEFLAAGGDEMDPWVVMTRCRIHGHIGIADGSAIMNTGSNLKLVTENGKVKLTR